MRVSVERIKQPKQQHRRLTSSERCSMIVESSGSAFTLRRKNKCKRFATFKINRESFCAQHAGETALRHAMADNGVV